MKIEEATTRLSAIARLMPWMMSKAMCDELGEHPVWNDGDTYFFAVDDGTALSFVCLSTSGRLKYAYTDKAYRRCGYFSMLMQVMEEAALEMGRTRITATATDSAIGHYLKMGWTVTKSWKKYHNIAKQLQTT